MNEERRLRQRAWYYSRIYADPCDAETVYVLNTAFYRSTDWEAIFLPVSVLPVKPKKSTPAISGG